MSRILPPHPARTLPKKPPISLISPERRREIERELKDLDWLRQSFPNHFTRQAQRAQELQCELDSTGAFRPDIWPAIQRRLSDPHKRIEIDEESYEGYERAKQSAGAVQSGVTARRAVQAALLPVQGSRIGIRQEPSRNLLTGSRGRDAYLRASSLEFYSG